MQIWRWRNVLLLKRNRSFGAADSAAVSFHSTPVSLAKWKNKWNSDAGRGQQPSKNYIRYATRQKRADAKKALKDLLFKKLPFQDVGPIMNPDPTNSLDAEEANNSDGSHKQYQPKNSSRRSTARHSSRSRKGKSTRDNFHSEFDEQSETIFRATFGSRCYTWSFRSWDDSRSQSSSPGFEWRDQAYQTSNRKRGWDSSNKNDDGNESYDVGLYSHRKILGLPLSGPIKIEDVKSAFRSSALKWHPDKHEGASQAMAGEKFKVCVEAYKSLCSVLSSG